MNYNTTAVNLLLGNGDGTYTDAGAIATGAHSAAVGDFTGDDITDVLVGKWGNDLAVLPGHGDGTFAAPIHSSGLTALWMSVTDFNCDGRLDVFAVQDTDDLGWYGHVYLGRGNGAFDWQQTIYLGIADWLGTGDFDANARPDVAIASFDYVAVLLNDGVWPNSPQLSISSASLLEGNAGTVGAVFTVTLENGPDQPVTVQYSTADGSATAGDDYQESAGTLTFAPGETSKTITVPVIGDRLAEPNETFFVNLSGATHAAIAGGQGVGTVLDDEPRISITADVSRSEGNGGQTPFTFAVTLSTASDAQVTVDWATADGTASAGSDYQAKSGTLTFAPGETGKTINVPVNGDRLPEPDESFVVTLGNPTNAVIASNQSAGTIKDDEPKISIGDVTKAEGKNGKTLFTFTVTLSAAYDQPVTMSFKTVDGTATSSDADYIAKTGTLTFKPGETSKTITIEVKGDTKKEVNETFYLDLSDNSGNSLFTKKRGVGTILNDD